MNELLGLILGLVGVILALIGFIIGKELRGKHVVISDTDILDGLLRIKEKTEYIEGKEKELVEEAEEESREITKRLQEVSNEEIVRLFRDAFGSTPPVRPTRGDSTRG